jgi:ubiquinone/menaquinone biosynthesis C-methylase UbiE
MTLTLIAPSATPAIDFGAIKKKQQATWASGDFAIIGTTLQIVGETLCEAVDVRAGERVIDVAAGNGNATLAAARRFARVTSTDYVAHLLDKGAARATAEGLSVAFTTADAEALPFDDGSFDVALSTFGVMFAPDAQRAAAELARVVRPGGRIGLASWTPTGFLGDLFKVVGRFAPPPAGVDSPMQWGDEARIEALFAQHGRIAMTRRNFMFRYHSAAHWIEVFRDFYGPTHKAFASLDEAGQRKLHAELIDLLASRNTAGPSSLVLPGEYLEVVVTLDGGVA